MRASVSRAVGPYISYPDAVTAASKAGSPAVEKNPKPSTARGRRSSSTRTLPGIRSPCTSVVGASSVAARPSSSFSSRPSKSGTLSRSRLPNRSRGAGRDRTGPAASAHVRATAPRPRRAPAAPAAAARPAQRRKPPRTCARLDRTAGQASGVANLLSSSGTPGSRRSTVTARPDTSRTSWNSGVRKGSSAESRYREKAPAGAASQPGVAPTPWPRGRRRVCTPRPPCARQAVRPPGTLRRRSTRATPRHAAAHEPPWSWPPNRLPGIATQSLADGDRGVTFGDPPRATAPWREGAGRRGCTASGSSSQYRSSRAIIRCHNRSAHSAGASRQHVLTPGMDHGQADVEQHPHRDARAGRRLRCPGVAGFIDAGCGELGYAVRDVLRPRQPAPRSRP